MASPIPEWQTEEIVEDVPEFLGGKRREVPVEMVRHRGRVPPKKNIKNSVSPKAIVEIQTFECQAIEDDLATDSLCAPSPLTLEIGAAKPTSKSSSSTATNTTTASPPNRPFLSVRASPDRAAVASPAPSGVSAPTTAKTGQATVSAATTTAAAVQPRPPATRMQRQVSANPRQVTPSKLISGTPNLLSPSMNDVIEQPPTTTTRRIAPRASTTTRTPPSSSSGGPGTAAAAQSAPAPSPPSARSLDNESNNNSSHHSSASSLDASGPRRVSPNPVSAPVGQSIPVLRRDISAPNPGQNGNDTNGGKGGGEVPRKAYSADVPSPLAAKQTRPTPAPRGRVAMAPVKPPTPATTAATGTAPQPASRSRTAPRSLPASAAAVTRTPLSAGDVGKADAALQPPRAAAASPEVAAATQRQREANAEKGRPGGPVGLPDVLPQQQIQRPSGDAGDYGFDDLFASASGGLPVSEQEPRLVQQKTRTQNVNNSMASSAGYSVLRGAFDSYATMDFNSTLPSLANLNGTLNGTTNGSRVNSARPANMMTVNGATALRAKGPFVRGASAQRRQPGAGPVPVRGRAAAATPDDNAVSNPLASEAVKQATQRRIAVTAPRTTPEADEADGEGHDKHRKRAPQTKRELRRRSTEFEKV